MKWLFDYFSPMAGQTNLIKWCDLGAENFRRYLFRTGVDNMHKKHSPAISRLTSISCHMTVDF